MRPTPTPLASIVTLVACSLLAAPLSATTPAGPPVAVEKTVVLYDGGTVNDLAQFYTWLAPHGYRDPNRVFTVVDLVDGAPAIRISGEDWGGIVTRAQYDRYKLVAEFRWGSVTWGKRKKMARNSGVLIHCQGEDGNNQSNFGSPWIQSIEYEIQEGQVGDVIMVGGFPTKSATERVPPRATMRAQPGSVYWDPQGTPTEFAAKHLYWRGRDPAWKDVLGFRGAQEVEKMPGEWNRVEVIVDQRNLTYFLNGVKIMEMTNCSLTHGRLLFQAEGAEIFFRRIELQPLGP